MIYREYTPPPAVADLLICSWTLAVARDEPVHQQRVLPDPAHELTDRDLPLAELWRRALVGSVQTDQAIR